MPHFQVSVSLSADKVEELEELFFEVGGTNWNIFLDQGGFQGIASGVYTSEEEARADWNRLGPYIEELLGKRDPLFEVLPEVDWKESYKDHFQAWSFEGMHWVPVWEKDTYPVPEGEAVVWLDPGMAFGTGNHESTRLCLESLVEYLQTQDRNGLPRGTDSCCDAGCGSGILAISAKRLGIAHVSGFDIDADAVRISRENSELNNLAEKIDFWVGDLDSGFKNESYDLVFANILASVLLDQPVKLMDAVNPGGRLILSGILSIEVPEVQRVYECCRQEMAREGTLTVQNLGEWSSVIVDFD